MKHTQGKWSVKQTDLKKAVVCGDMTIASNLYDENKNPPIEEIDANAKLISLAPEMLQELKMVALGLEHTDSDWAKERLEYVRETIASAEGE
jgi:hypothetical protein